jgi:undecaprenyl-diphosphatase
MNIFHAFLLGIIQGLTEFIPVSSTAHLLIGQRLLGLASDDYMFAFLVIIQLGTLVSLFIFYWQDLLALAQAFFARPFSTPENTLAWYIIIATIPAALIGFLLRHVVEEMFRQPLLEAAVRLLAAAALLTLAEWLGKRARTLDSMTWFDALIIGVFQVIAVFPGASRSGTTISGGMLRGFDRPSAARFGFLMSIPIMLGAGGYQMLDVFHLPDLARFLPAIAIGFMTAAVVGWFSIRWLLAYLGRNSLYVFAIYCAAAGMICILLFQFFGIK